MDDACTRTGRGGDLRTRYNAAPTGALDRFVQRFGPLCWVAAVLAVYAAIVVALALALAPAFAFATLWYSWATGVDGWLMWPLFGAGLAIAGLVAGFGLLVAVPLLNFVLPTRVRPFRGGYFSLTAVPWALHNGLFYFVRYTFLPYVTLTPFGLLFLRAMGMRIGRHAFINTEMISDPRLITIGDDAVIGGSVHLFAHYGGGGHLHVAPVVIGARATIGQKATVMGDVVVGEDATVLPHAVLLPGTRVGAGETWGGVPARRMTEAEVDAHRNGIARFAGQHPD